VREQFWGGLVIPAKKKPRREPGLKKGEPYFNAAISAPRGRRVKRLLLG